MRICQEQCLSNFSVDLMRNLEELDQNVSMLTKIKNQLNNELEDVKKFCEDEAKERQSLMGRFRNLEHEYDGMSTVLDEEITSKENLQNWQSLLIEHAYFLLPLCFDALWQTRDVPLLSWIVAHNYLLRCKLTGAKETNALRDIYDFVSKENPSRDRTAHWWFEKLKKNPFRVFFL